MDKLIAFFSRLKKAFDPIEIERRAYELHMSQANSCYDIEYYDRIWTKRKYHSNSKIAGF